MTCVENKSHMLNILKVVDVKAIEGRKTAKCLKYKMAPNDPRSVFFRDPCFDTDLPEDQRAEAKGRFEVWVLNQPATLRQFLASKVGLEPTTDVSVLQSKLQSFGYFTTLPRVMDFKTRNYVSEDPACGILDVRNFFLVLDKEGQVRLCSVCNISGWIFRLHRIEDEDVVWSSGARLFLRS